MERASDVTEFSVVYCCLSVSICMAKRTADERDNELAGEQQRKIMHNICSWDLGPRTRVPPGTEFVAERVIGYYVDMEDYDPHSKKFKDVNRSDRGGAMCNFAGFMAFAELVKRCTSHASVHQNVKVVREQRKTTGGAHAHAYLLTDEAPNLEDDDSDAEDVMSDTEAMEVANDDIERSPTTEASDSEIELGSTDGSEEEYAGMVSDEESVLPVIPARRRKVDADTESHSSDRSSRTAPDLRGSQVVALNEEVEDRVEDIVCLVEEVVDHGCQASIEGEFATLQNVTAASSPRGYMFWMLMNNTSSIKPEKLWNDLLTENAAASGVMSLQEINYMRKLGIQKGDDEDEDQEEAEDMPKKKARRLFNNNQTREKKHVSSCYKNITHTNASCFWDFYTGTTIGTDYMAVHGVVFDVIDVSHPNFYSTFFSPLFALLKRGNCDLPQSFEYFNSHQDQIYSPLALNSSANRGKFRVPALINRRMFRVDVTHINPLEISEKYLPFKQLQDQPMLCTLFPTHFSLDIAQHNLTYETRSESMKNTQSDVYTVNGKLYNENEIRILNKLLYRYSAAEADYRLNMTIALAGSDRSWAHEMSESDSATPSVTDTSSSNTSMILAARDDSRWGVNDEPTAEQLELLAKNKCRKEIADAFKTMETAMITRTNEQQMRLRALATVNPKLILNGNQTIEKKNNQDLITYVSPIGSIKELLQSSNDQAKKALRLLELSIMHTEIRNKVLALARKTKRATNKDMCILQLICQMQAGVSYVRELVSPGADISDGAAVVQNCKAQYGFYEDPSSRPLFHMIDPTMSPFENVMASMLNDYYRIENACKPPVLLIVYLVAIGGNKPEREHRIHVLILGPPGQGKTWTTDLLKLLLCSYKSKTEEFFRVEETSKRTTGAMGTNMGGKRNFVVQLFGEISLAFMNGPEATPNQPAEGDSSLKIVLDTGVTNTKRAAKNDDGEWVYQESVSYWFAPHIFLGNIGTDLPPAILDRLFVMPNAKSNTSLIDVTTVSAKDSDVRDEDMDLKNRLRTQHKFMDAGAFDIEMLRKLGNMNKITVWLATLVIQEVNRRLKKSHMPELRPRDCLRITELAKAQLTLNIISRECMMTGGILTNEKIVPEKHFRQLDPAFYIAPRHIVSAMCMHTQIAYMPCTEDTKTALLEWYEERKNDPKINWNETFWGNRSQRGAECSATGVDDTTRDYDWIVFKPINRDRNAAIHHKVGETLSLRARREDTKVETAWSAVIFGDALKSLSQTLYLAVHYENGGDKRDPRPMAGNPTFTTSPVIFMDSMIRVNTAWLFDHSAVPQKMIVGFLKDLFGSAHQPEFRTQVGFNKFYPNTFDYETFGNENPEDPSLKTFEYINPHYTFEIDTLTAENTVESLDWRDQLLMFGNSKIQVVDCSFEELARQKRHGEIHFPNEKLTERDIGKMLYMKGEKILGEDRNSPLHGRPVERATLDQLDDNVDILIPRDKFKVPVNGRMVNHWDVLYDEGTSEEKEETYFMNMTYTDSEIAGDRILKNEPTKSYNVLGLPDMFRAGLMPDDRNAKRAKMSDVLMSDRIRRKHGITKKAYERELEMRRVNAKLARKMAIERKTYTRKTLADLGIVDPTKAQQEPNNTELASGHASSDPLVAENPSTHQAHEGASSEPHIADTPQPNVLADGTNLVPMSSDSPSDRSDDFLHGLTDSFFDDIDDLDGSFS